MTGFPADAPVVADAVWLVAFCDPEPPPRAARWRDRLLYRALCALLRPGFRHCYAMRRAYGGGWVLFNPHSARTDILDLPDDAYPARVLADAASGRGAVVVVAARRPVGWVPRGLFTCVASVAHLLGVPSRPWTTPHTLYRHLKPEELAMGGVFSAPKADTSAAETAAAKAQAEADALKAKNEARLRVLRAGSGGRSLLTFSAPAKPASRRRWGRADMATSTHHRFADPVLARFARAEAKRRMWDAILHDTYRLALPNQDDPDVAPRGGKRDVEIFDGTAIRAVKWRRAKLHGDLFPPFRHWTRFLPDSVDADDLDEEAGRAWSIFVEDAERRFHRAIDRSNFHLEVPLALGDALVSTGAILIQEGTPDDPLRFEAVPIAQVIPEESPDGTIRTVFRAFDVPGRDIA